MDKKLQTVTGLGHWLLLRMPEVAARTQLSPSYLYDLISRGVFPPFIHVSPGTRALPEHVLDAWLASCLALRATMLSLVDHVDLPIWDPESSRVDHPIGIRMLRRSEVLLRVGMKHSLLYREIGAGRFPRPAPLGQRARRWAAHEIDTWRVQRTAASLADAKRRLAARNPDLRPY